MASRTGPDAWDPATRALLAERYGAGRNRSGRVAFVVGALLSALFLGWLAWATWDHARPTLSSEFVGFQVIDEHTVEVRFDVRRKDAGAAGACTLRALAEDHSLVGEATIPVDPSTQLKARMTRSIRTERLATSVELVGCQAPDQSHPR